MILALDLSLTATGFASWQQSDGGSWYCGDIKTTPKQPLEERLGDICLAISKMAHEHEYVFLEDYVVHSHASSVSGMVHGAVRYSLWHMGICPSLVPPKSIKTYGTGRGNATKDDMRMELYKRLDVDERNDNVVDAMWLACLAADLLGHPIVTVPQTHRRALDKLAVRARG